VIDCVPLSLEFLDNMLHTQLLSYCVIGYNLLKQPVPVSLMGAAIRIHFVSILIFQGIFSFVWWNVPMLQALIPVLHLLLPRAYFSASNGSGDELSSYLKSYNEVLHCFVTIGIVYPEDTFTYLLHRLGMREDSIRLGAFSVVKHLLTRLSAAWNLRKAELAEAVRDQLQEKDLKTRKAVAEVHLCNCMNIWGSLIDCI
jgi:hypothetical protein